MKLFQDATKITLLIKLFPILVGKDFKILSHCCKPDKKMKAGHKSQIGESSLWIQYLYVENLTSP